MSKTKRSKLKYKYERKKTLSEKKTRKNTHSIGGAPKLSDEQYIDALNVIVGEINNSQKSDEHDFRLLKHITFTSYTEKGRFMSLNELPTLFVLYNHLMKNTRDVTEITIKGEKKPVEIENNVLLNFVINRIRNTEREFGHPDLLNTFLYYFGLFDFPVALQMMNVYLSQLYSNMEFENPTPQKVRTILEKSLVNHSTFDDFDVDTKVNRQIYNMYTIVPDTQNSYQNAINQLNQMISQVGKPYNNKVGEFTADIGYEKGNMRLIGST
jgi:hypothetical protein